jgi:hypothetical protein
LPVEPSQLLLSFNEANVDFLFGNILLKSSVNFLIVDLDN